MKIKAANVCIVRPACQERSTAHTADGGQVFAFSRPCFGKKGRWKCKCNDVNIFLAVVTHTHKHCLETDMLGQKPLKM